MSLRLSSRAAAVAASLFLATAAVQGATLTLANGDRVTGRLVRQSAGTIYFHSDLLGELAVPADKATVSETSGSSPSGTAAAAPAEGSKKAATAVTLAPARWSSKFEFGYDNAVTNVRAVNISARAEAEHKEGPDDVLLKGRYIYGVSAGQPSADQTEGLVQWRHNLSERLFSQTQSQYDSDKLRKIHEEYGQNVDLGYHIFQSPRHTLNVGAGVNGQYLNATGIEPGFNYLGNAFQDYTYKINRQYTLIEDVAAEYSPERRGRLGTILDANAPTTATALDYAYKFHSTLQTKINPHVSLNLHFEYEFDNAVLDPAARAAQRVSTTLGYDF